MMFDGMPPCLHEACPAALWNAKKSTGKIKFIQRRNDEAIFDGPSKIGEYGAFCAYIRDQAIGLGDIRKSSDLTIFDTRV